jgi:ubiquinone biosynthesis O-methyltransferase
MKKPVFDQAAAEYDSWYTTELGQTVDSVENKLIQALFTPQGSDVLEVGCGTGLYTSRLAEKGLKVTALDISEKMMEKAKERLKQKKLDVQWIQADIHEILPKLGTYDGILSMTAFEFIPNPEHVLSELFKHLNPGGCLVIGVIAGNSSWSELYTQSVKVNPESVFATAKFYTPEEMKTWKVGGTFEIGSALYFPPQTNSFKEAMSLEEERRNNPGFIVGKWVKQ